MSNTIEEIKLTTTQSKNLAHFLSPNTKEISEGEILGIKKAYNACALSTLVNRNAPKNARDQYVSQLEKMFEWREANGCLLRIGDKQDAKERAWLKNMQWTPRGIRRKNPIMSDWLEVLFLCMTHFELEGFHEEYNGYRSYYSPIYKVCSPKGNFRYICGAWQSGSVSGFMVI